MLQIFITIAVIQVPLFIVRLEHFDHLHGTRASPAELSAHCYVYHGRVCTLASAAECLLGVTSGRRGRPTCNDQIVSGPALGFHIECFRKSSFLAKMEIPFWEFPSHCPVCGHYEKRHISCVF